MKKALCVGINHFKSPGNDLAECIADARTMDKVFDRLGITNIQVLVDAQAAKAKAWSALTALVEEAKTGNLSYLGFSWSGHGTHYPRPQEPDGLGEALVCYDIAELGDDWDPATIIKDKELHDLLNQVPPSCLVEVWLDTCFSGGMDRDFLRFTRRYLHNPGNKEQQTRLANSNLGHGLNSNIVMWAACSEAQTSADAPDLGNGAFTYFWNQAYRANAQFSRVQLLVNTRRGLQAAGYEQVPRLKAWNAAAQRAVGS